MIILGFSLWNLYSSV